MYTGRILFSQVIDFLPMYEFRKCVQRYKGNYHVKGFSCFDQFLCMAFAQLTYRESLRDIEACKRVGVKIIAVSWGWDPIEAIQRGNPDIIADTPADVARAVEQLFGEQGQ